ncbi:MAG: acylneuraminate cytidylyltransferase family protein [Alphaproteobacteria bacterium]|jgi:CMP-N,N'-diacetyllegionaminic acid synthase
MTAGLLILVPARGGSKRLADKNVRPLAGRSLIARTADAVAEARLDAPVVLTTDDDAIAAAGERAGMLVPFRRPAELAGDTSPTIDAVLHALDWFRDSQGGDPDTVMVLQPTSPLRGSALLRTAVERLATRPDIDSVVSMTAVGLPANRLFFADANGRAEAVSDDRRYPVYMPNGALYLARTARVRAERTLYAGAVLPLVLDPVRAIDIDTADDWRLAEAVLAADALTPAGPLDAAPSLPDSQR